MFTRMKKIIHSYMGKDYVSSMNVSLANPIKMTGTDDAPGVTGTRQLVRMSSNDTLQILMSK